MSDNLSEVASKICFILETANKNRDYFHFLCCKIHYAGASCF